MKDLIDTLRTRNDFLLQLSKDFRHQISDYDIVTCYELKEAVSGMGRVSFLFAEDTDEEEKRSDILVTSKIVEKWSACLEIENEEHIPMDVNHHELCKFASQDDSNYQSVYKRVVRIFVKYQTRQRASQCT